MWSGVALVSSLLASTALANPLALLQPRQAPPASCASYNGGCTNTLQKSSATAWCQSLGFGASTTTVTVPGAGTVTARKTIISTTTVFTATTTKTAPSSTSIFAVTKTTVMTTILTQNVTSTTKTVTINAAGTIDTCGTYTATYNSAASTPSSTTPSSVSGSTPTSLDSSDSSTTSDYPPVTSPPWVYPSLSCATAVPTYAADISRSFNYCVGQYAIGYSSSYANIASPDPNACVDLCTASCVGANYYHYNNGGWGCALQYSDIAYSQTGLTNPTWTAYILAAPASNTASTPTSTSTPSSTPSVQSTPTSTPTSTATAGSGSSSSTSTNSFPVAPACTDTAPPQLISSPFQACPQDNLTTMEFKGCSAERTSFTVSCGSDMYVGQSYPQNYNPGPYKLVSTLQACAAACLFDQGANCGGVTLLTGAPDGTRCYYRGLPLYFFQNVFTMDTTYPPYWGLPDNGGQGLYWTSAERLNYGPDPNAPSQTEASPNPTDDVSIPGWSIMPSYLPQCSGSGCYTYPYCPDNDNKDWTFPNDMGGSDTFHTSCGSDILEQGQRTNYWVWAGDLASCIGSCMFDWGTYCGGVTFIDSGDWSGYLQFSQCFYRSAGRQAAFSNTTTPGLPPYDTTNPAHWISALKTSSSAYARRDVQSNLISRNAHMDEVAMEKRDDDIYEEEMAIGKRAIAKPACLTIPASGLTTTACNCVIPSTTTTRTATQTLLSTTTSIRTVFTTLKAMSTATTTPIKTVTKTVSTSTNLLSRTTTLTIKTAATTTTTGTWTLATTPTSFYIVDANNGVAMWPADADEIFYNVQYDDSPESTDPPPTNFGLNGTQLIIQDFVDSDVVVVGQPYSGTGAQVMAFDRKNAAKPNILSCKITALADGTCPLTCTDPKSKGNVSWTDSTGLWYLMPPGATGVTQMKSFVLQAGDDDGGDGGDVSSGGSPI